MPQTTMILLYRFSICFAPDRRQRKIEKKNRQITITTSWRVFDFFTIIRATRTPAATYSSPSSPPPSPSSSNFSSRKTSLWIFTSRYAPAHVHVLLCAYVTLPLSCRRPERDRPGPKDRYPVGVRVFSQIRKRRRFSGGLKKQPSRTACYAVFCFFFLFSKIIVRITYGIRSRWPRGRRGGMRPLSP